MLKMAVVCTVYIVCFDNILPLAGTGVCSCFQCSTLAAGAYNTRLCRILIVYNYSELAVAVIEPVCCVKTK